MKRRLKLKKLNKTSSHRKAMFANMAVSLIFNEQIKTTLPKAKAVRPIIEKLVTKAKTNSLSIRRFLISKIKDEEAAEKLMSVFAERYKKRMGGYTRIIKNGYSDVDNEPVAYIEFVDRDVSSKGSKTPPVQLDEQEENTQEDNKQLG